MGKYSISAMCKILKISRSLFYYKRSHKLIDSNLENLVISIFEKSKKNYGARKIDQELQKHSYKISRKRIRQIMVKYGLVSNYTIKNYKSHKAKCNEENISNVIDRNFKPGLTPNVIVSDLTYVNVGGKWNYICILLNIFNREIIGYSAGTKKNAELVKRAFATIKSSLCDLNIFHTDRGSEFKNRSIDDMLKTFKIKRSLSKKGNPYDNSVAEATFKIIKTELVMGKKFKSINDLRLSLSDYVNWFNNHRIHGSLEYVSPIKYKIKMSE
jgi:putative transposase